MPLRLLFKLTMKKRQLTMNILKYKRFFKIRTKERRGRGRRGIRRGGEGKKTPQGIKQENPESVMFYRITD